MSSEEAIRILEKKIGCINKGDCGIHCDSCEYNVTNEENEESCYIAIDALKGSDFDKQFCKLASSLATLTDELTYELRDRRRRR